MRRTIVMTLVVLLGAGCPPKSSPEPATPSPEPEPVADAPAPKPSPKKPTKTLEEQIDEAAMLIEKGGSANLEKAIIKLESLSGQDDTGTARFNLGVAYHRRGDLNRAMNQYQAVIATDPDNGLAWLYLGKIQEEQGIVNAALNNYRSGIRNDPENMKLRVALIGALRNQGKAREAIDEAKEALKVNALSLEVYNNLGLAYLDLEDYTLAKFTFQKALQSITGAEQNAYLKTNLGWTFYNEGNIPAAKKYLEEAVELDKEFVPALVFLSRVYMDDHNYADTVPLLETAAKKNPNNADVQLTLGVAYRGMGELDKAEAAYEKALALDPSDPAPHFNLGVLLGDYRKDYDGAIAAFNQYIASGGSKADLATEYIDDVSKEKSRAERRAKAEADRKKREEERKKREELLQQAEEAEKRRQEELEKQDEAAGGGEEGGEPTEEGGEPTEEGGEPTEEGGEPTEEPEPDEGGGEDEEAGPTPEEEG